MTTKANIKIYQGGSLKLPVRWESAVKAYKPITTISKTAPVEISTVEAHGIPSGWRVKITNVLGMKEINSEEYQAISAVLPGSFQLNNINSVGYTTYTSGGIVEYNVPMPLTGFTGKMQIRPSVNSEEVYLELDTATGGIVINIEENLITINITPEQSKELNFNSAVYSLELTKLPEIAVTLLRGNITLIKEVTR